MPYGGFLRLSAENVYENVYVRDRPDNSEIHESETNQVTPRNYVAIQVTDTGTGIPDHILSSIFDPFFTTKADKGTGLGLSTSRDIVQSHGGFIDISTDAVHVSRTGTQFRVYLPAAA